VAPDLVGSDLLWLAAYGAVFLLLAVHGFRREELRKFS